ncbi:hypothetical protein BDZ97DRAFT_859650 [Flammula alnicola]|nr:hypothetical protein BDZ97DRAFT_859650 [Flammula alnicola]
MYMQRVRDKKEIERRAERRLFNKSKARDERLYDVKRRNKVGRESWNKRIKAREEYNKEG